MKTRFLTLSLLVSLSATAACAVDQAGLDQQASHIAASCEPLAAAISGVVFSNEEATHVVDMVDNASAAELRAIDGIGSKTAERIIAGRPYRSLVQPLSALDEVPYVGAYILSNLKDDAYESWCALADGRQSCCIELACETASSVAGVAISDDESYALLDWANRGELSELDAVCGIGPSLAQALINARPLRGTAEVLDVRGIGNVTLYEMLGKSGYGCASQGTVAEEWCGLPDASCTCQGEQDGGAYLLDEDAAANIAEESAGQFYLDNSDSIWEEYCQGNYDESAGYDEFAVMTLCDQYLGERYFQAAIEAAIALAGTELPSEDDAFAFMREFVETVFFDGVDQWELGFPAYVDDQLG